MNYKNISENPDAIAIIGMSGIFPQAKNLNEYWDNLINGIESIIQFKKEKSSKGDIVCASAILDDIDCFDAKFFNYSAYEAEILDPQQRLFLQCCWHALEDAGYCPDKAGNVGVFAGSNISTYLLLAYKSILAKENTTYLLQLLMGNDKDYLATRVSYKLNLTGPSLCVQSACSTSLLSIHTAVQSLLNGECKMALAGGVNISIPQEIEYEYKEGMIFSPDGHCKAFDEAAKGTVAGNGVGVVVLKRLSDAIEDGDFINAVILGSAVNNDGANKIGYTAPSIEGQANVIAQAIALADIPVNTIDYIETHGTGTPLGDPIEIRALSQVFKNETKEKGFCAIGSVKTNIGHLNSAAGIASFIKTVLSLKNAKIPPSLHYTKANPEIDFLNSAFFVNNKLSLWPKRKHPRRAGVSSFGFGGTNVHMILEQAPIKEEKTVTLNDEINLIVLSAQSQKQLRLLAEAYNIYLHNNTNISLQDISFTSIEGRKHHNERLAIIAKDHNQLQQELQTFLNSKESILAYKGTKKHSSKIACLFTGQGSSYVHMAKELYNLNKIFRQKLDLCAKELKDLLDIPLLNLMFGKEEEIALLSQTKYAQPSLFALEYSLYHMYKAMGVEFTVLAGHSVGEIVAACVSDVFSLKDALKLITTRGRIIQSLPTNGGMIAIFTEQKVVDKYLKQYAPLCIAARNGPEHFVISGLNNILEQLVQQLNKDKIDYVRLEVSHAFHSALLDPILDEFEILVASLNMQKPKIPIVSNLYGRIVKDEEIITSAYWREHMRKPVLFMQSIQALENMGVNCFLECGPHPVLTNMGKKCVKNTEYQWIYSLHKNQKDKNQILLAAAQLYCYGVDIKYNGLGLEQSQRVSLPTYPFEKQRYWLSVVTSNIQKPLNIWDSILKSGNKQAQNGSKDLNINQLKKDEKVLISLAQSFIIKAFKKLDLFIDEKKYTLENIFEKVIPQYHQLVQRFLEELNIAGLVHSKDKQFWHLADISEEVLKKQKEACNKVFLQNSAFKTVFLNSGYQLAEVLSGKIKAIDAMMMNTSLDKAKEIYSKLPTSYYFNTLLRETVKSWVLNMPENKTLKILEIGAGTGATSEQLLPLLTNSKCTYYYTDVSNIFLQKASKNFKKYKFVNYFLFDINKSTKEQGLDDNSFDLIIASNVLHAADDLYYTMSNISKLLKSNGMLFMYEIVKETLIGELTTGLLLPLVKDTKLRGIQPFMTKAQWESLLMQLGFKNFHAIPEENTDTSFLGERILLAQQKELFLRKEENSNYFYHREWHKNKIELQNLDNLLKESFTWVICSDKIGYEKELISILKQHNHIVYNISIDMPLNLLEQYLKKAFSNENLVQLVYLWGIDNINIDKVTASVLQEQQSISCLKLLDILSSLSQINLSTLKNLSIVTTSCQNISSTSSKNIALSQTLLWGFAQVVALGHPELHVKLIDLDTQISLQDNCKALLQNLLDNKNISETQLILRQTNCYLPRIRALQNVKLSSTLKINIIPKGWYVIAGGLGGLGLKTALWLIEQGAKNILLIGRNKPSKYATQEINSFIKLGVNIKIAQVDITDYKVLKNLIDNLNLPLKGIIHSAVVRDSQTLGAMSQKERFFAVTSPKLKGAWNLHKITENHKDLDLFILYSSSVSLIPARGIPEYVASNTFLDGLAHYRRSKNLPALSISWGAWAEVGTVANTNLQEQLKQNGLNTMSVKQSFNCLNYIVNKDFQEGHFGIFDVNWNTLLQNYPKNQLNSYFKDVIDVSYIDQQKTTEDKLIKQQHKLLENIKSAKSFKHSLEFIKEYLKQKVSVLLRISVDEVPLEKDLLHLGIDSLMFIDLLNNLNQVLQIQVKPNELMSNLNINAISQHLLEAIQNRAYLDIRKLLIVDKNSLTQPFPLTDIQQAYWIGREQDMDLGNIACHGYMEIDCKNLDITLLEEAWNKLIQRHEMLRCIILPYGQQQILKEVKKYHFTIRDFSKLVQKDSNNKIEKLRKKLSHRVPKTDKWPLFDIHVSKLQNNITRLHISLDNIMTDGRSIGIMLSEWVYLYHNPQNTLPELSLSFRDYIMSFEAYKQTDDYTKARQYWINRLDTIYPSAQLPLIKATSEVKAPKFIRRKFHLNSEKWQRLKSFGSQKAGLTPSGILLSVYAQVLSFWSNSSKFSLNIPTFNRLPVHEQVNSIVGEFTSLILLSIDLSKKLSFKEHASILQKQLLKDQTYDSFTGISVMRELVKNEKESNMPIVFTSTFGLAENINTSFSEHENQAKQLGEQVYTISQTPQVYIDNHVHDYMGTLNVYWDCVDELFPKGMLDNMFEAYGNLLEQLANDEHTWESLQPIKLPKEQNERRKQFNTTQNPKYLPLKDDLLSGFLHHVKQAPNNIALIIDNDKLSYKQLFERACFFAWNLQQSSIKSLDKVAILLPKGWQQISSIIATLGINATYIPFDYNLPEKRLLQLLKVAKITYVITSYDKKNSISWHKDIKLITTPSIWTKEEEKIVQNSNIEFKTSNNQSLAYIIYTSGSTGTPKGVMISHRSALNTILDINDRFNVTSNDVVFGLSGVHFDLSVYDIFGTLNAGACLVLPNEKKIKDTNYWIELILKHKISLWNSVPALCQMLLIQANANNVDIENIRLVLLSGDWIPLSLKEKLQKNIKNAKLYSLGGATEASIWSIYYPIENIDSSWNSIPYGNPLANQQFYILNEKFNDCPDWVEGDLYIGGEGLFLGYYQDEEKTKEAFIFHPKTGEKIYKTGDKGRFHPNGYIEFLGRNDLQVKINGHRIELAEIESSLLQHKLVQNVVVTAIDNYGNSEIATNAKYNKQKLIAYCVCNSTNQKEIKIELKSWLEERLPSYMIPNHFYILDSIPLTNNGKVNRKALPLPIDEKEKIKNNSIPQTQKQKLLVSLCKQILQEKKIYISSNFFDIGGDSLQATRLSVMLQQQGFNLSVNQIFLNPILEDMAHVIKAKESNIQTQASIEFNNSSNILTSLSIIDDKKPNIFCIHGSDGGIAVFNELANQLENNFNIYGIAVQNTIKKSNIIDIAKSYLEQIKILRTSQPLIICGFSSGGFLAWEIARQLEERKESLDKLILIDTHFLPKELKDNSLLVLLLFAYTFNLNFNVLPIKEELIQKVISNTYTIKELREMKKLDKREFETLFEHFITINISQNIQRETLLHKFNIFKQSIEFSMAYKVPYLSNIDALLLHTKQSLSTFQEWNILAYKIKYVEVEGNHISCLQPPHVNSISNTIRKFCKSRFK
ncbi:amino acid adenylation domain-containing protein [Malaciobacter mytili]|uniref:amino acid adenylation domain-containing protein n=1 Tax=Malaciobacter mytili TaxID=603050 RepID=UPI003BAE4937